LNFIKYVKLWDIETGKLQFEFSNNGDEKTTQGITCMTFDRTGRRLITGGRNGECKIWNFNNGHCLKTLRKSERKEENQEIADVICTQVYNNIFIVTVGWDRSINIYDDDINDLKAISEPLPRWEDDIVRLILSNKSIV
jgi:WD40 repeat protein